MAKLDSSRSNGGRSRSRLWPTIVVTTAVFAAVVGAFVGYHSVAVERDVALQSLTIAEQDLSEADEQRTLLRTQVDELENDLRTSEEALATTREQIEDAFTVAILQGSGDETSGRCVAETTLASESASSLSDFISLSNSGSRGSTIEEQALLEKILTHAQTCSFDSRVLENYVNRCPTGDAACEATTGLVPIFEVTVGNCLLGDFPSDGTVVYVERVDCDSPHVYEVYFDTVVDSPGAQFDIDAVSENSERVCRSAFLQRPDLASGYSYKWLQPTLESWSDPSYQDRTITCLAERVEAELSST